MYTDLGSRGYFSIWCCSCFILSVFFAYHLSDAILASSHLISFADQLFVQKPLWSFFPNVIQHPVATPSTEYREGPSDRGPRNVMMLSTLWPSDIICQHRSGSTLAQIMACCLMAPSHYLNQCWLIISKVQWHSSGGNFTKDTSAINH